MHTHELLSVHGQLSMCLNQVRYLKEVIQP